MERGRPCVALYGGTFDPFHNGQLRMAIEVREGLSLPSLHLVPSAQPPHKPLQPVALAHHRYAMAEASVGGVDGRALGAWHDVRGVQIRNITLEG